MAYLDPFAIPYPRYTDEELACWNDAVLALREFTPSPLRSHDGSA